MTDSIGEIFRQNKKEVLPECVIFEKNKYLCNELQGKCALKRARQFR